MSNVIQLKPCLNASTALRNIADMMESGEITSDECTVIAGVNVFHCGTFDDEKAATNAIFNLTLGIQILMRPAVDAALDEY